MCEPITMGAALSAAGSAGAAAAGTAAATTAAASGWATALMAAGTVLSAVSSVQQGKAAETQAKYEAAQMERNAISEGASAQRAAIEQRRSARLAQSRVQALAGGSGMDAGVVDIMEDLEGEGEYRAMTALYEGKNRAAGLGSQAAATRYSGKQAKTAGMIRGAGSLLSSGSSLYEKYGK